MGFKAFASDVRYRKKLVIQDPRTSSIGLSFLLWTQALFPGKAFDEIWFHSLNTALCARELTLKYEPLLNAGEVWTSALLHDIGKLVYLKFFPEHYEVLRQFCSRVSL